MTQVHGMHVVDNTPGLLGGAKTLNVRRTGAFATQSLEGGNFGPESSLSFGLPAPEVPGQPGNQYHTIYEENISDFIKNMSVLQENSQRLQNMLQCDQDLA